MKTVGAIFLLNTVLHDLVSHFLFLSHLMLVFKKNASLEGVFLKNHSVNRMSC